MERIPPMRNSSEAKMSLQQFAHLGKFNSRNNIAYGAAAVLKEYVERVPTDTDILIYSAGSVSLGDFVAELDIKFPIALLNSDAIVVREQLISGVAGHFYNIQKEVTRIKGVGKPLNFKEFAISIAHVGYWTLWTRQWRPEDYLVGTFKSSLSLSLPD